MSNIMNIENDNLIREEEKNDNNEKETENIETLNEIIKEKKKEIIVYPESSVYPPVEPYKTHVPFVVMIMNCHRYIHKAITQKNSWLKNLNILYFHVRADPFLSSPFVFDDDNNVLLVQGEDDYLSLPAKVMKAQKAIFSRYTFDFLFKTDDDQHLVAPNFFNLLYIQLLRKTFAVHYGGQIITIPETTYSKYYLEHPELPTNILVEKGVKYCTGRFYFLSFDAVKYLILNKFNEISNHCLEDYAIGYNLSRSFKVTIFNINTPQLFIG